MSSCMIEALVLRHLRANLGWYSVFISPQTSGNPAILHDTLRILTGDVKMLRLLTESRADINARTQGLGHLGYYDSMTPLMIATRSNQRLGFRLWYDTCLYRLEFATSEASI